MPSILWAEIQKEQVNSTDQLQAFLVDEVDSLEIYLQPGEYYLTPSHIIDSTCGNCEEPNQFVPAMAGLQIAGDYVKMIKMMLLK